MHFEGIQLDNGSPVNENSRNTSQDNGPVDVVDNSNLPDQPIVPDTPNDNTNPQPDSPTAPTLKDYFTTQNIIIAIILIGIAYLIYKN